MQTFHEFLSAEHARCDQSFVEAENAVTTKDWGAATSHFATFRTLTEAHFAKEEQTLFPALDEALGGSCPPARVMEHEHAQLREAMARMAEAVERRDADAYLGLSETTLMLLQQHNHKEEFILYPMADRALAPSHETLMRALTTP